MKQKAKQKVKNNNSGNIKSEIKQARSEFERQLMAPFGDTRQEKDRQAQEILSAAKVLYRLYQR